MRIVMRHLYSLRLLLIYYSPSSAKLWYSILMPVVCFYTPGKIIAHV